MSKEHRAEIESTMAEIGVLLSGKQTPEAEKAFGLKALKLVTRTLCDLNRIADAVETLAAPPGGK